MLGRRAVVTDRAAAARPTSATGWRHTGCTPGARGAARDADQVAARRPALRTSCGVPFVARGSGTGLSGGALPRADGVLVVLSPDDATILEVAVGRPAGGRRARGDQPRTSRGRRRPDGYYYAPDPSQPAGVLDRRQRRGELRRRALPEVRLHRQPRARARGGAARRRRSSVSAGAAPDPPGYDLRRRLRRQRGHARHRDRGDRPADPDARGRSARCSPASAPSTRPVRRSARSSPPGSCPAAIEMMDALAIEAAEAAVACGYPDGRRRGARRRARRPGGRGGARARPRSSGCASEPARSSSGRPRTPPSGR